MYLKRKGKMWLEHTKKKKTIWHFIPWLFSNNKNQVHRKKNRHCKLRKEKSARLITNVDVILGKTIWWQEGTGLKVTYIARLLILTHLVFLARPSRPPPPKQCEQVGSMLQSYLFLACCTPWNNNAYVREQPVRCGIEFWLVFGSLGLLTGSILLPSLRHT